MDDDEILKLIEKILTTKKPGDGNFKLIQSCYDFIDDLILLIDLQGRIKFLNRRAEKLMGLDENHLLGLHFGDTFILEEDRHEYSLFLKQLLEIRSNTWHKFSFHLYTGPERREVSFIRSAYRVIRDKKGHPKGFFMQGRIAEDAISVISVEASSAGNQDKSDDSDGQATNEFVANISHDIRTPLSAIMGFTEQLMQTKLDDKQLEYLKIIDKSSEHLYDLVNDILVYSKSEARQIKLDASPFKIANSIKYAFKSLKVKAKEKNIRFFYEIDDALDVIVIGDSFRLRQVLLNMLSNAIKFTDRGYVKLRCQVEEESGDQLRVRFDVIDTGIGISPDNLKTIFIKFRQAESIWDRKYGGTGLGLTICKNLIELQDGSLSVSSRENEGSTFSFVIPYEKARMSELISDDTGQVDKHKLEGRKILLVEDDSVNRLLGKTILEKLGCKYELAVNGREAIKKIDNNNYELILLDINLPDISGMDIALYIRNEKNDDRTKIVAFSAEITSNIIKEYKRAGFDDFLMKPYKEINLYNIICSALNIEHDKSNELNTAVILRGETIDELYDLKGLKDMIGSNNEDLKRVLNEFIKNSQNTIKLFQESMDAGDWKRVGEAAHKILPSYRHLKVHSVVPDLEEINLKAGDDNSTVTMPILLNKTIKSIQKVTRALKKELTLE